MRFFLYFCFVVVFSGCSQTVGEYHPPFVGTDSDTDTDLAADSGTDGGTDSGEDTDSISDSDTTLGSEDAGMGDECDGGACCSSGWIMPAGSSCVVDVLPEDVYEDFDPVTWSPHQFRCADPDVCGGGEEHRLGQTVCNGISNNCFSDSILWGVWETTYAVSPDPLSVCNPLVGDGITFWYLGSSVSGVSFYSCDGPDYSGCMEGACIPKHYGSEADCSLNFSDFYCGPCENNCFENGGSWCTGYDDPYCECGDGPACDEGFRCVLNGIRQAYECIPE